MSRRCVIPGGLILGGGWWYLGPPGARQINSLGNGYGDAVGDAQAHPGALEFIESFGSVDGIRKRLRR